MRYPCHTIVLLTILITVAHAGEGQGPRHLTFQPVPFTEVSVASSPLVNDNVSIWADRLRTNREISIPHNYRWCEETGRFDNFAKAAGLMEGKFVGIYFNDSDVYKLLEGTAYSLRVHPDPALEKRADQVIDQIAAAQQPDGYLNTYYQLVEPDKKWTNTRVRHELYCCGHLIEAAVAYAQATGKTKLLDVAEKFVAHIRGVFGPEPGKRVEVPGHEEIELALVKLYRYTGKKEYLDLATFFIDVRGDQSKRTDKLHGPYSQDHQPVRDQREIVGHAVRAVYLYAGAADIAAYTGDEKLIAAMDTLWNDVVHRKMYITGGIGARHQGEAFGDAFELPNKTAYCETCAAIGLVFWAHRLNLLHGDGQYADVVERAIYNGVLAGIGRDGKSFFYVNPLASDGRHHRQPFFDCACCPTNVVRFVPSLPGYVYATDEDGIIVNQFIPGEAVIAVPQGKVTLRQRSRYPWDGRIDFSASVQRTDPNDKRPITIKLRVPSWSTLSPISIKQGDAEIAFKMEKGYAVFDLPHEPDCQWRYEIPFTYRRTVANPQVAADRGRVAFEFGPIVYCFEEADNPKLNDRVRIKKNLRWHEDIQVSVGSVAPELNDCCMIRIKTADDETVKAIPYFLWDSRKPGRMMVWVRQKGLSKNLDANRPLWIDGQGQPVLYQPLPDDWLDNPVAASRHLEPLLSDQPEPESPWETLEITASHCHERDTADELFAEDEPQHSDDHAIRRLTFWNHKGTNEWVEFQCEQPMTVSRFSVYWFDDAPRNGGCRVPRSAVLSYRDGDTWKPINVPLGVAKDKYNEITFPAVTTEALRLDVSLQEGYSGGLLRVRLDAK